MRAARARAAVAFWLVSSLLLASPAAHAQQGTFVAPPRTIADITAILDQQKPSPDSARKLRADADAVPPSNGGRVALARFHFARSHARALLGEFRSAIADAEKAVEYGRGSVELRELGLLLQNVALQHRQIGNLKKSLQVLQGMAQEMNQKGAQGRLFNTHRLMVETFITLGDLNQAEVYVRRNLALIQQARGWNTYSGFLRAVWESDVEQAKAALAAARGQFAEAEGAYRRGADWMREGVRLRATFDYPPPLTQMEQALDGLLLNQGKMKSRQGRLAEGEADVRRTLLNRLKAVGKYHPQIANYIAALAELLVEQGRLPEAEKLQRSSLEIQEALGMAKDSQRFAATLNSLAIILNLQGRWDEAAKIYAQIDEATRSWEPARKEALTLSTGHIATLYNTGNVEAGIAAAERLLARQKARFGESHIETAFARGSLAIGLARARRDAEAMREFKAALPILVSASRDTDMDFDATEAAVRDRRMGGVITGYLGLLARTGASGDAAESFRLGDVARGRSVQQALAASATRSAASNPALAELVRKQQDLQKQIGAQLGLLNNRLASPPEERDDNAVVELRRQIDKLRADDAKARQEIKRRFPKYADLIEPKPATVEEIRHALRPDEALLSFYFGIQAGFVWAVPKDGPVQFAVIRATTADIERKIKALRKALDTDASSVSEIPPFDTALAHELYALILHPVEAGWKPARNLIVVTNGTLGTLPLDLLPTAPSLPPAQAGVEAGGGPIFSEYRNVSWLARTHTVTMLPAASALLAQRQQPAGAADREPLIGFGDPFFSEEQARQAAIEGDQSIQLAATTGDAPIVRRAAVQTSGVDSAELAQLQRLPDTAQELKSIALALGVDPDKTLYLGKEANEQRVKASKLSSYRVVAFATHGLLPGDLDGLTQPALALTAPKVAGVEGDGLLTMEEILALKLDADWVVLSACNTAAGAGAGADVASGLGRAFFYAGTRALLVTNWSVDSASARDLVADLFRRQSADPQLRRDEALRQAMMAMVDGGGLKDRSNKIILTYAHPLFWAPYSIIGDGR